MAHGPGEAGHAGSGAVRRTLTVLLLYAAGAWVVLLLGRWLSRVLVLPMIFDDLLRWGVYLGAGVAALVAWFYPVIAESGHASGHGASDGRSGRDRRA